MPYSGKVIRTAIEALKDDRQRHRGEFEQRRSRLYTQFPRLQEIDRAMARTVRDASMPALDRARAQNKALQRERAALLRSHGQSEDALTYQPLCDRCGDQGWVGSEMCQCLQERCARVQMEELSSMLDLGNQSFETFDLTYYSQIYNPALKTSPREQIKVVLQACSIFANHFNGSSADNLYLTGQQGLGKTFLSAAIARVVSAKGYSVVYDSAISVFSRFEAERFGRDDTAGEDVKRYLTCDLMILDDLGSEMATPLVHASLYQLINTRLLNRRSTIISSNLSLKELDNHYSPQVTSRIQGEYTVLPFYGEDIRIQRSARKGR